MRFSAIALVSFLWLIAGCDEGDPGDIDPSGTTSGTSSGGGHAGGSGGSGPCTLGEPGSCGSGQKCSVVDPVVGTVACVTAGAGAAWDPCTVDADCAEQTYCDALTGICKPLCFDAADCPAEGRCVPAVISLGEPIAGLSLCTAACHPLSGEPCSDGAACVAHNPGDDVTALDCVAAGAANEDAACATQTATSSRSDCMPGLMCVVVGGQPSCKRWCTSPGTQAECEAGETCTDAGVSHMSAAFGVCP